MTQNFLHKIFAVLLPLLLLGARPGQASTITNPGVIIMLQGGNASVTWDASLTGAASLEYSADLSDWSPISSNNTEGSFQHPVGNATKGFYRLIWAPNTPPTGNMIAVQGGTLRTSNSLNGTAVSTFQIGKYEVTWGEWKEVRAWAVVNGYGDLAGVGGTWPDGSADNFPVLHVNWYDVCKWMNARSEKEGLVPVYTVNGTIYRTGNFGWNGSGAISLNSSANGYRLPLEKEWEWAARGGVSSQGYTYSGSNDVNAVAWYRDNSSDGTKAVGTKAANELGIHDMSGNVWEWCWDLVGSSFRRVRGGGWSFIADNCTVAGRGFNYFPDGRDGNVGFRLARSSGN